MRVSTQDPQKAKLNDKILTFLAGNGDPSAPADDESVGSWMLNSNDAYVMLLPGSRDCPVMPLNPRNVHTVNFIAWHDLPRK